MKKLFLLLPLAVLLVLAACGQPSSDFSSFLTSKGEITHEGTYQYTRQMSKPDISEMTNRTAMNEGFQEEWSTDFLLEKEFVDNYKHYCHRKGDPDDRDRPRLTSREFSKELQRSDIVPGNVLTLTGLRHSEQLLHLTPQQQQQVTSRGRTIVEGDTLNNYYKISYNKMFSQEISYNEERVNISSHLGGSHDPASRYPFNTVLITNDLLLHVYHKLFDNGLKYYEEQIARPTIATLSEKLYKQYLAFSNDRDQNYAEIYQFLAAYWAIPHIFLPSNQKLMDLGTLRNQDYHYIELQEDLTDQQIKTLIKERSQAISKTLAPTYQKLIPQIVEKILKAEKERDQDYFLAVFADDFLNQPNVTIQQDYTQFKPRAHYTDSSLLKTYFMAMKWLMREKFYFGSPKLTQAAFVMVNTIKDEDLQELNQLSEQITNLIGTDDDVTLNKMKDFVQRYVFGSETIPIPQDNMDFLTDKLRELHPQKIQSTHYTTPFCAECITEDTAKSMTDGFVFFGEKFTLDSYLFDLMTAGSAEVEFVEKPNVHTALIVPDILEDSPLANQLVHLRLQEKSQQKNIAGDMQVREDSNYTQFSSYDRLKAWAKEKIIEVIQDATITTNVYHKRLKMIGLLLQAPLENAPYRHFDPFYQLKNLVTYMGSYTELKHDTLLYVKQAYAEMGGGGPGGCDIYVETPALPVPKGYIEAQPDFLDKLMTLNTETTPYFTGTYEQAKFIEFGKILEKLKEIGIKQMHNEVISDEDFERLRLLATSSLQHIVIPTKTIGTPSQKEMRGALIADIFTSEIDGPLYEAIGRPAIMLLMVNDINGGRVVLGPVFTHYEFYGSDDIIPGIEGRYTDEDRQDQLHNEEGNPYVYIPAQENRSNKGLSIVSRELKKGLEKTK